MFPLITLLVCNLHAVGIWHLQILVAARQDFQYSKNKLTNSVEIIKQMCFTLDETRNYITEARLPTTPVAVVLHVLTNDLTTKL
jgi:hypothetical protein